MRCHPSCDGVCDCSRQEFVFGVCESCEEKTDVDQLVEEGGFILCLLCRERREAEAADEMPANEGLR